MPSPDLKKYIEITEESSVTSPMTVALYRPLMADGASSEISHGSSK